MAATIFDWLSAREIERGSRRALSKMYRCRNWSEVKSVLRRMPILLSDDMDGTFGRAIIEARRSGNEEGVQSLESDRALLRRCREAGIDRAFAELSETGDVPIPPELAVQVQQAAEAQEDAGRRAPLEPWHAIVEDSAFADAPFAFRARCLDILGNLYADRFREDRRLDDLSRSIELFTTEVSVLPLGWSSRAEALNNLGNGLVDRYDTYGQVGDLDLAEQMFEEALQLAPPGFQSRPILLNGKGNVLHTRYRLTGRQSDLDAAIAAHTEGADLEPEGTSAANLGADLVDRYQVTGQLELLERAITILNSALANHDLTADHRRTFAGELGRALSDRYLHEGSLADLDAAIAVVQHEAVAAEVDHPELLNSWSVKLLYRYERLHSAGDLDQCVELAERALAAVSEHSLRAAEISNNLANALEARLERDGRAQDLERLIALRQSSLRNAPAEGQVRANRLSNLGNAFLWRYHVTQDPDDLERAIDTHRQALSFTADETTDFAGNLFNLAGTLRIRYENGRHLQDLLDAINAYRDACFHGMQGHPDVVLKSARAWGAWAMKREQWSEAAEAYAFGLEAGRQLDRRQANHLDRETWLREVQGFASRGAFAFVRLGDPTSAVEAVEQARTQLMSGTLNPEGAVYNALIEAGQLELAEEYRAAAARVEHLANEWP